MGMKMRAIRNRISQEEGSISPLIITLFLILLSTSIIITNISSVYIAKRSLSLATEAAVQRGMKNLNPEAYYSGEFNANRLLINGLGGGQDDPGIPIDCNQGREDAIEVMRNWQGRLDASVRKDMGNLDVDYFACDGFQIYLETSAIVKIPLRVPFIDLQEVSIRSYAGAIGIRAETNNYYGLDIG